MQQNVVETTEPKLDASRTIRKAGDFVATGTQAVGEALGLTGAGEAFQRSGITGVDPESRTGADVEYAPGQTLEASMTESLETQRADTDFDTFASMIEMGSIRGIGSVPLKDLQSELAIVRDESKNEFLRAKASKSLMGAMNVYNAAKPRAGLTAFGSTTFQPTPGAVVEAQEGDDALLKAQGKQYGMERVLFNAVSGNLNLAGLDPKDARAVEEEMIATITTNELFSVVQTRVDEGLISGSAFFVGDAIFDYIPYGISTALEYGYRGAERKVREFFGYEEVAPKSISDIWKENEPLRMAWRDSYRAVITDPFGLQMLNETLNDVLVDRLEKRFADDPEKLEEILRPTLRGTDNEPLKTPDGRVMRGRRDFVSEDAAAQILTAATENLTDFEQFFASAVDTGIMLYGVTKGKVKLSQRELKKARKKVDEVIKRGDAEGADANDVYIADRIRDLPLNQQISELVIAKNLDDVNLSAINNALEIEASVAGANRIKNEMLRIDREIVRISKAGSPREKLTIGDLQAQKRNLQQQYWGSRVKLHGMPIIRTTALGGAPLAAAQYFSGEYLTEMFSGDRMASEAMGAMFYLIGGRPILKFSSWGLSSLNYKIGNPAGIATEAAEDFIGATANIFSFGSIKGDFVKGAFTDRDINAYVKQLEARSGRRITYKERKGLEYIKKLSSVLDDDSRQMVARSIEKYTQLREDIVGMLPANKQVEGEEIFNESFAVMSNLGWMRSAAVLSTSKVNIGDLSNAEGAKEARAAERMNRKAIEQANFAIRNLEKLMTDNVVDPKDRERISAYIETLRQTTEQAKIDNQKNADNLLDQIEQTIIAGVSDPDTKISGRVIDDLIDMGYDVSTGIREDLTEGAYYARSRGYVNEALMARSEALKSRRGTRERFAETSKNMEVVIVNHMDDARDTASSGFRQLDEVAGDTTINIGDMVLELYDLMEGIEFGQGATRNASRLQNFFSSKSDLFRGRMGKRAQTVFENMANRALSTLSPEAVDNLIALHRTEFDDAGERLETFLGTNANLQDIVAYKLSRGEFNAFQATPKEVMDMVSIFHDYAVSVKDPALAREFYNFADRAAEIVAQQAPEFEKQWRAAADTYKVQWFDKFFRQDGPVAKLRASQKPGAFGSKETREARRAAARDEDVTDTLFGEMFMYGYGSTDPQTFLNPLVRRMEKALRPGASATDLEEFDSVARRLIAELADRDETGKAFFDASNPESMRRLGALQSTLGEFMYDAWASKVVKNLDDTTPFRVGAVSGDTKSKTYTRKQEFDRMQETGGYKMDPIDMRGVTFLEDAFTVEVRGKGRPRDVKILDLEGMVSEQRSIEKLIEKDEDYAKSAIAALESFAKRVDAGAATAQLDAAKDTESLALVKRAIRIETGEDFVSEFITKGGGKKSVEQIKEEVRLRLQGGDPEKTTITVRGTELDIDDAVDRGIKLLLFDGIQSVGGVRTKGGQVQRGFGDESFAVTYESPEVLFDILDDPKTFNFVSDILGEEHAQYIKDISEYMALRSQHEQIDPRLEGLVKGFGVNQFISRAFNIRRGMVSPQYVAAEVAVSIASQAGMDMMKFAANDEQAARLMRKFIEFPDDMTKAELDMFSNQIITFVVTEGGYIGLNFNDIAEDIAIKVGLIGVGTAAIASEVAMSVAEVFTAAEDESAGGN